jgi:hypothetical protein
MASGGARNQHVTAGRGELGQYGAWIALRRLDGHVNVAGDATHGGPECLPDKFRGRLARHVSPKGQDHVPAAVAATAQAAVPRLRRQGGNSRPDRPG